MAGCDDDERDEGAEDDHYEGLDDPYFTPGRPLNSYEEFRMIKGFAFDPYESEYTGLFYDERVVKPVTWAISVFLFFFLRRSS